MNRFLLLCLILFLFSIQSAYAGFTSPANGISSTGNFTVSWQGSPQDIGVLPAANYGTPLYKLTEQRLNSGLAPTPIALSNWTATSVSISGKAAGQYVYTYSERICTVSGCTYYTPPEGRLVVTVGSNAVVISEPSEPATSVGATAYSASVNDKGESVVSVPIQVHPGAAGMQPSLGLTFASRALDYSSSLASSGWLGYGWSMSGVSMVSRCSEGKNSIQVYINPGVPSAGTMYMRPRLQYNDTDNLCLDGQLLVLISGTHLRVGAQYRTQGDTFRLVTIKGVDASPWVEVRNPNGSVATYGKENNSKVQKVIAPGGTTKTPYFIWSIDSETDSFGNTVLYWYAIKDEAFSYQPNKQRIYPDFIQYSGGTVKFHYQYMSEPVNTIGLIDDGASAGVDRYRFQKDGGHQLTRITLRKSDVDYKTYILNGSSQTAQEIKSYGRRLGSIQECGVIEETGATTCLSPISFAWYYNSNLNINSLESVTDSLGVTTKFLYGSSGTSTTMQHPFATPSSQAGVFTVDATVVTTMHKSNGLVAGQFYTTSYDYYGGGIESDNNRGLMGFRAIKVSDWQTGLTTYKQFSSLTAPLEGGMPLVAEQVFDANSNLLSKIEKRINYATFTFGNGALTRLPIVDQITTFNYEKGTLIGVSTKNNTYNLDTARNVVGSIVSTTVTGASVNPISFTPNRWGDNAPYVVNPSTVKTSHQKITTLGSTTSATDWRIGFTTREENRFYNGVVGGAGVDSKTQFVDYTMKPGTTKVETETHFTNDPDYHLQITYGYHGSGLPSTKTVSGVNVESRTETSVYGSGVVVPSSVTNTYGHTKNNSNYDARFGLPRTISDENGLVSTQTYDAFGRIQIAVNVDGAKTTENYVSCASSSCEIVAGKLGNVTPLYYKEIVSHIKPKAREYYDVLGRLIRKETEGFTAGEWFRTDVQYDERGYEFKISLPYKAGASPQFVVKSYDNRGRIISIQQPDGGLVETIYATESVVAGERWLKATTTETVKKSDGTVDASITGRKIKYTNAAGQLVRIVDAQGSAHEAVTNYSYDALGNVTTTTVNGGGDGSTTSTAVYDKAGMLISFSDPNAGTTTSKYTALGELRQTTDAKGTITSYTYDRLGRLRTRSNSIDGASTWTYDPVGANGLLSSLTNNSGYSRTYFYQDASRAARLSRIETAITVAGVPGAATKTFTESLTYDIYGRIKTTIAPTELPKIGYTTTRNYNARGYPESLWRDTGLYPLQIIAKMGPFGIEDETLFNASTKRAYDSKSGRLLSIATTKNSAKVQDFSYQWYTNGSLQTKTDSKSGTAITDTYLYDTHDRLTSAITSGGASRTQSHGYNKLGNITNNTSNIGTDVQATGYAYNSGRPHAVSSATINGVLTSLGYDANGAITSYDATGITNDKYISYNSINQPTIVSVGGSSISDPNASARDEFKYAPDGVRYYKKSSYWQNGVLRTEHTFYVSNYETTFYDANSTISQTEKTIVGPAFFVRKTSSTGAVTEVQQVLHRDHLGSVTAVTDATNTIIQLAFESFGFRRNSSTLGGNISSPQITDLFVKMDSLSSAGFTGHENLDRTGFIHMNGRIYDPRLSRFLSPDPLVQSPTNSQSWNRYSYVFNNPLKFRDPSGYQAIEETVTTGKKGCDEKCQREGNARVFMQMVSISTFYGENWAPAGGKYYNIADIQGMTLFALAQGAKPGGGSKTDSNNILSVLYLTGIKEYDSDGVPTFNDSHPNFHHYYLSNSCDKSSKGCTLANAKQGLMRYPAPGASGKPVSDEQEGLAIPVGTVRHEVNEDKSSVINVTLAGRHILHPGIVRRWVTEDANRVTVHTYGEGTGALPRHNEFYSEFLWDSVDSNIFEYMSAQ